MAEASEITAWLVEYIAARCKIPAASIERTTPFNILGVDSLLAVSITVEMEEEFGIALPPTALLEFNTIGLLSEFIQRSEHLAKSA